VRESALAHERERERARKGKREGKEREGYRIRVSLLI